MISISKLKAIPIFAILCFHVFNKMTIRRIKKNKIKFKDSHIHVEEQIGRTNVEEYCYFSKLHS